MALHGNHQSSVYDGAETQPQHGHELVRLVRQADEPGLADSKDSIQKDVDLTSDHPTLKLRSQMVPTPGEPPARNEHVVPAVNEQKVDNGQEVTYWQILRSNKPFRFYLASYIANHVGEWLTYLAAITAIEHILTSRGQVPSKIAISRLILCRLLPNVLMCPLGGALADGRDRRKVMIVLDILGASVSFLFVLAVEVHSLGLIYVAAVLQEACTGLYEPSRTSIVPLLVPNEDELKKATTIMGLAWSVVAAFGAAGGGAIVDAFGIRVCFLSDGVTYLISALLMLLVGGKWTVKKEPSESESPWTNVKRMILDGLRYITSFSFGAIALMKASAALSYGATDVLYVSIADQGDPDAKTARLGILFSFVGMGCTLGPIIFDQFTSMSKPKSLQVTCLISFFMLTVGFFFMAAFSNFWAICFITSIRSSGTATIWINSSLLLQKFSSPELLGRVSSIDFSLAILAEAWAAHVTGAIQDNFGLNVQQVSFLLGVQTALCFSCWCIYHYRGGGAAGITEESDDSSTISDQSDDLESSIETKSLVAS